MLLSNRYNFLFIHIAKTGGSSIRSALNAFCWKDPFQLPAFISHRLSHLTGHRIGVKFPRHAGVIAAKEMLSPQHFDGLFKFAFVRNPWGRLVSAYHHLQREHSTLLQRQRILEFADFTRWIVEDSADYRGSKHVFVSAIRCSQASHLVDLQGACIVDFVGRYENLIPDFHQACRQIGISARHLPHKRNSQKRHDFRQYYDDKTAEVVAKYYRVDAAKFGYRFDAPCLDRDEVNVATIHLCDREQIPC